MPARCWWSPGWITVVTGITNKGRDQEMASFQETFAPLLRQDG